MVISKAQAAEELGFRSPHTVTDIVDALGITLKPVRSNAKALGLDECDLALIRRRLGIKRAGRPQPAAQ